MSGNEQPQQAIMGAIQAPLTGDIDHNVPQPRQPSNLQGLLRFAMEATKAEDAPGESSFMPLDEEVNNTKCLTVYIALHLLLVTAQAFSRGCSKINDRGCY